jgi:hypothetical protein
MSTKLARFLAPLKLNSKKELDANGDAGRT